MASTPVYSSTDEIRPKKTGIWIGISLMVLSFIVTGAGIAIGLVGLFSDLGNYDQLEAGTSVVLELDQGDYTVFTEDNSSSTVTIVGDDGPVEFDRPSGTSNYTADGSQWYSALSFDVKQAGSFEVTNEGPGRISIGPPFGGRIAKAILLPMLVGFLMFLGGLVLLVVTLMRRRKARQQLNPAWTAATPAPM